MSLSQEELCRYKRQIAMPEININGQHKLKSSKIIIIGAGGLGSPTSIYLAASGIGNITIVDYDKVELSNLNRQILHNENSIGKTKIESAIESLQLLNTTISIKGINTIINMKNAIDLISDCDLLIDCLDDFKTRYLLNEVAWKKNIPLFHAGINGFFGQVTIIVPYETPCLQCIIPYEQNIMNNEHPVLGVTAGIIGSMLAGEVIKYILGEKKILKGKLLFYDFLNLKYKVVNTAKRNDCPICGREECL